MTTISLKELLDWEIEYDEAGLQNNELPEHLKKDKKTFQIINYFYYRGRKSAAMDLLGAAECLDLLEEEKK